MGGADTPPGRKAEFKMDKTFVTAGKAIITVSNGKGEHFTYQINKKEAQGSYPEAFFVNLLTGPDNTSDYSYLGILNAPTGEIRLTKASRAGDDAKSVKVIRWALSKIWKSEALPEGYTINHDGRCGKCARLLTTPDSVARGIGPECAKQMAL
jgi:hypothetical protein